MNKLLNANFARLKKNKVFWLGIVVMVAFGLIACLVQYNNKTQYTVTLDSVFAYPYIMSGILLSIFCSLFIGTEYSDGTIRNKIIVGHSRSTIFLANFVVSATVGIAMNLAYLVASCALGIPLLGFPTDSLQTIVPILLAGMLSTVAFAAIYTMISMLNQSKALSTIICSIGILAAIFMSSFLYSKITEPEFIHAYQKQDASFEMTTTVDDSKIETDEDDMVLNPSYLSGSRRAFYQFLIDFLPSGQMLQISDFNVPNLVWLPLYSLFIILVINLSGVFFFRRMDLK